VEISLKNEIEDLSIIPFLMSSSLKNETVTSLEPSFHPPFSFFSSTREIGDNLKVDE